jgi:hypothetical protein
MIDTPVVGDDNYPNKGMSWRDDKDSRPTSDIAQSMHLKK